MNKRFLSTLIALAGLGLGSTQAEELAHSYDFFDVGYERTSYQGMGRDILDSGNGIAADFALSPKKHLLFAGEFHWSRPQNAMGEGINTYDIKMGAGFYFPVLGENISFYTHVGPRYLKAETGVPEFNPSDWGVYVEPGIRVNLTGNLEVYGAYEYTSIFESNLNAGKVGLVLHFSENLAFEAFGRFDDKWAHAYGGGLRFGW